MKRLFLLIIAALLLTVGCSYDPTTSENTKKLELFAFSIGKADALLIRTAHAVIMIDAGENGDGEKLVSRLSALGVEKLDLLILTHYDKDHIGGADAIVQSIPIDRIVLPKYDKESKQYRQLTDAFGNTSAEIVWLTQDLIESFGDMNVSVWPSPVAFDGKSDNQQSLVTKILYEGKSYLFMGDAEKEELKQLIQSGRNLTCDVLKLPHHGVYDENTEALLLTSMPSYVIICDSEKNPAEEQTLEAMQLYAPVVLQTKNGDVHLIVSEGVFRIE